MLGFLASTQPTILQVTFLEKSGNIKNGYINHSK